MTVSPHILTVISAVRRASNIALWAASIGYVALFGLQYPHPAKWDSWRVVVELHRLGDPILTQLDNWLEWPTAIRYYPLALALFFWIIKSTLDTSLQKFQGKLAKPSAPPPAPLGYAPTFQPTATPSPGNVVDTATNLLSTLPPDSEQAREELLRRYREIEEALKSSKRKQCTFLSVDVVDSTHMKDGAGDTEITVSFRAYEEMLKRIFRQYGAWKQAWTPDGVMVCFLQRELAVGAAHRILQSLETLNTTANRLRVPFTARCGIHEGEVSIYEDTVLERLADRVIDIAGHLQKQSNRNTLWVSEEVYQHLQDKSDFRKLNKVVDGYPVYGWAVEPALVAEDTFIGEMPPAAIGVAASVLSGKGRIGRYEILEELGRGAKGAVYKASDPQIGRTVAIKVILAAGLPAKEMNEYKQRFYREAQAAGQMTHPGIVTIHDIGEDEAGRPFLVMEYVQGVPLDDLVKIPEFEGEEDASGNAISGAVIEFSDALDIAVQVAEALDYAHRRGVIHRDIKPANILITPEGRAKILDFGVAQLSGSKLTQAGRLVGTPAFMSPEQFVGGRVDARSDLFSLGTVLYWMVTGQNPFSADTLTAVAYKVSQTEPPSPLELNPKLPPRIASVLSRCLAKDPEKRYPTGATLVADLQALRASDSGTGKPTN